MRRECESHPITAHPAQIDARGIMVFDNICRMPVYDEPFSTAYMTIGLNLEGWVRLECDTRSVTFRQHDIAVLSPHHVLCTRASSDDYRAMLVVMSPAFREEMKRRYTDIYRDNINYRLHPSLHLDESQFAVVHQLFHTLQNVSRTDSPRRWDMMGSLIEVLFLLLRDYRQANGVPFHQPSLHEETFVRFHRAIVKHYRESREVKFYADMLHLSPKYFSSVIKQQTGTSALDWINGYVIIQARMILRHHPQMSVLQIALNLGFPDQASFSRFFKKGVGLTPTEYREQR